MVSFALFEVGIFESTKSGRKKVGARYQGARRSNKKGGGVQWVQKAHTKACCQWYNAVVWVAPRTHKGVRNTVSFPSELLLLQAAAASTA